jgi:hypothetical protein
MDWKFDASKATLQDIIALEELQEGTGSGRVKYFRDLLIRLSIDKTEEEIDNLSLTELGQVATALGDAVREAMAPPKANSTG